MNIFHELKTYTLDYILLVFLLGAFIAGFFAAWPNTSWERALIALLAVAYFAWGITHHYHAKKLHTKIVLEYFFASALAGTILLFLTI